MEWQRIVELFDPAAGSFGSGYLLAPGLVLTAAHVVYELDSMRLRLLEPDEDGLPGDLSEGRQARVVWRAGDDSDLALLEPEAGAPPFREPLMHAVISRLGGRAAVRVDALGFPRVMLEGTRGDTLHVEALVNALTGVRGTSLLLDVQSARPREAAGWKGMSGAAVFGGDCVVGVVERVSGEISDSGLRATRADVLFTDARAAKLLRNADVTLSDRAVDAAYVDALPRAGHWGGVRERYARAVVTNMCRIDHVGLAVGGVSDRRLPALAAYTAQRLLPWLDEEPVG
jgi:hypothetical protein